jgi:hypothetical protein
VLLTFPIAFRRLPRILLPKSGRLARVFERWWIAMGPQYFVAQRTGFIFLGSVGSNDAHGCHIVIAFMQLPPFSQHRICFLKRYLLKVRCPYISMSSTTLFPYGTLISEIFQGNQAFFSTLFPA